MTAALYNTLDNTPIVFTAVTDPVMGGFATSLTQGKKNITGVIDAIPIKEQLAEFKKFYDFKRVGVIYTSSETNSISMVETTKKACAELGLELVLQSITTPAELKQAAESMVDRVDAFYCFTDNSIATAMSALTETAAQKKIPVVSAGSGVSSCALPSTIFTSRRRRAEVFSFPGRQAEETKSAHYSSRHRFIQNCSLR